MTIVDGSFDPDDKEEILDAFVRAAERAFGESLDPDDASVIRAFYEPVADYLAAQQEDIAEVLRSTQIDNAEGEALDLLAALIGVSRLEATPAETILRFSRDTRTTKDYTVPEGSKAQTDEADPVVFASDEPAILRYIDGFEDNDIKEYTGDTGVFSVQSSTVESGSYALEASASTGIILDTDKTVRPGSVMHLRQRFSPGTTAGLVFAVQDANNYYTAVVDQNGDEIRIEKTDDGSTSTLGLSGAGTVPDGEWLDIEISWDSAEDIVLTLDDASGSELGSVSVTDGDDPHPKGGIGFESLDASATKYFDEVTMSAVGVQATATEAGVETNVGAQTATVLGQSIAGIDSATNVVGGTQGRDTESDEDYRDRAKRELSTGMRASLPAIITRLRQVDGVGSVHVIDNDTNSADGDGRPGHSFEAIVEAPSDNYDMVARRILETKAAGDTSVGGYDGTKVTRTLDLVNGQSKEIAFSEPSQVKIYVDVDLSKTSEYAGDDAVRDSIVQYIGGTLSGGGTVSGELTSGDDVIYNQMVEAVMDVEGVFDISNLEFDATSTPTGTSNYSIADTEVATTEADDSVVSVSSSDV